jgi:uncharacterized protein (DUF2336 family)
VSTELDIAARVRQGADATTSPEVLKKLAVDPSITVRASLALNPALPLEIRAQLANDKDERVRLILSRKIASLVPSMPSAARGTVQREAIANLTDLVAQAALRVRTSVAAAVRDLPDGPREIVLHLANDPEVMIAEPIIRFSPMLSSADLIALVRPSLAPALLLAVAQRSGIDEAVADAIVESANTDAITALLVNHSAQIREATLDALAAQSEEHVVWQEPLVRRPRLPVRAQRLLADIVTGNLLETLAARHDLDPKVSRDLARQLQASRPRSGVDMRMPDALAHANALRSAGRLDDMAMLSALRDNAIVLATAMFAVRTDAPVALVQKLFEARNAKAIVALAWRAGMSMQTTIVVQAALVRLPPDAVLRAGPKGAFPIAEDEMRRLLHQLGVSDAEPRRWTPRRLQT